MSRVMVIGLDGATFDLILPWTQEGHLPHFQRLLERSAWGELRSTLPPMTFPAWSSFMTGKNPGKHGIYDFTQRKPNSYDIQFINASWRRSETMWALLSRANKRVAVVAVPTTFPPERVNGIMISGFDAPGMGAEGAVADPSCMYPSQLYAELRSQVGEYYLSSHIIKDIENDRPELALQTILRTLRRKAATAQYIFQKEPWDFFMVLFGETDLAGHHFWRFHDPNSPFHPAHSSSEHRHLLLKVYQEIDAILGELMALAPDDANIFLMSDHGFGGSGDQVIHLNKWLEEEGFLTFKSSSDLWARLSLTVSHYGLSTLEKAKSWALRNLPPQVKKRLTQQRQLPSMIESWLRFSTIDWKKTLAFSDETPYYPTISINCQGREPQGIVKEGHEYKEVCQRLIERLQQWNHPITQQTVAKNVYPREEIYWGPYADKAPDIIVEWNLHHGYSYLSKTTTPHQPYPSLRTISKGEMEGAKFYNKSGNHRLNGIFLASGPNITPQAHLQAEIVDLAPTILHCLGLAIPEDMDGQVREEIFSSSYRVASSVQYTTQFFSQPPEEQERDYSPEEEEKIKDRLRELGYLE